ncbi:BTB/POZ domain-containing protein 17-like [Ptychodera flava]|uniref:BTB/POZ domain-containing protein 17-like n=1 Tax=Ptychodera flava TaxID=63121 RepID=UPI00396A9AE7
MAFSRNQRQVSMSVLQSCAGVNLPKEKVGLGDAYGANLTKELYNKPELSDVVLRVGKNDYHVHKFLLAHFSDVMKTMLMETRWGDAQKHIVELTETDEAAAVFDSFLRFMYCGQIEVNIDTAIPILALADKYNVKSLKSVCSDYMEKEIFHYCNVRAALLWWQRANSYNSVSLDSDCFDLIVLSLDEAIASPEWQYLDIDQMCAILETSQSIVSGEYFLYEAVEKWLQSTGECENLRERVERVLPLIRFSSMTPEEIKRVEQSSFYEQFKIKFMPHLYEAFKQLALKDHHRGRGEGSKFHLLKMPRCYTGPPGDQFKSQSSYAQGAISFESFSTIVELSKKSLFNVVTSSCKVLYRHCPKNASMNEFDFATEPRVN